MKTMPDNFVDSIVTDPPYGLSFMGKVWDYEVPNVEIWKECLRVLKPGGHLLAFAGTRTQHRMAVNIEDAGFEIRDMIVWVYGSGFPKSMNIGKSLDKVQGNEREVVGSRKADDIRNNNLMHRATGVNENNHVIEITKGNSEWEGWGTALKPALEPITLVRKPLSEKTVVENVLKWGTGGINIDGCRITHDEPQKTTTRRQREAGCNPDNCGLDSTKNVTASADPKGRFPANFIHDGSDEVVELFPTSKSASGKCEYVGTDNNKWIERGGIAKKGHVVKWEGKGDSGSNARFFYVAKTSKKDRDDGCDELEEKEEVFPGANSFDEEGNRVRSDGSIIPPLKAKNNHPTVKPTDLMRYLCRLVTPKGGIVLDPFMGSGSTGRGALLEGFKFIGIEMDENYCKIAEARIKAIDKGKK